MQAHGASPNISHVPTPTTLGATAATSARPANPLVVKTQIPISASNADVSPATVTLKNGLLTVQANNSDLSQILKDIAGVSGMNIDGSMRRVRVFGVYGPSNPRDVITDLLTGLGYNFMMLGVTHEGAPRELQLTLRSGDVPASGPTAAVFDHHEPSDVNTQDQDQLGPGAVVHAPPAAPDDPQDRVRQNLQRLQQMHDQQKPQNPPQ